MERLGRYILVERIAAGGTAEVHLAAAVGVEGAVRPLAIKTILPQEEADRSMVTMLLDEARICSVLHHPNIVQVLDVGKDKQRVFMVMEYVSGRHLGNGLGTAIRNNLEVPVALALHVTREVFLGLDHAHTRLDAQGGALGIVHRDISPQNILLGFDGTVRVADFGIARAHGRRTRTAVGTVKGKAGYMSPEQARGETVDALTDVYAMGVVLWEMLSLQRMYSGKESVISVALKVAQGQRRTLEESGAQVDRGVRELVESLLQPQMARRLAGAAEGAREASRLLARLAPGYGPQDVAAWMGRVHGPALLDEEARRVGDLQRFAEGVNQQAPSASNAFPVLRDDVATVRLPQRSVSVVVPKVDAASIRPAMDPAPALEVRAPAQVDVRAPTPESEVARLARAVDIPDPPMEEPAARPERASRRRWLWSGVALGAAGGVVALVATLAQRFSTDGTSATVVTPPAHQREVANGMPTLRVGPPSTQSTGILRLSTQRPMLVFVDGEATGRSTPLALELAPGWHDIFVVDSTAGVNHHARVEVSANGDRDLRLPP